MRDSVARKMVVDLAQWLGFVVTDNGEIRPSPNREGSIVHRVYSLENGNLGNRVASVSLRSTDGCESASSPRPTSVEEVNAKLEALAAHFGLRFVEYQAGGITNRASTGERGFVVAPIPLHPDAAVAKALEELGLTEASRNGVVGKVAWRVVDLILGRASAAAPAS